MNNPIDMEKVRTRIAEQRLMEEWQIKPGMLHWLNGYLFKLGVALEDIPAGSLLQYGQCMPEQFEKLVNCSFEKYLPVKDKFIEKENYPVAMVLHEIPKNGFFWAQMISPYKEAYVSACD